MREIGHASIPVSLGGLLRGRDLSGSANLLLRSEVLEIDRGARTIKLPLGALEGARMRDDVLQLFLDSGDIVEATGSAELSALAHQIEKRACIVPELTLSLSAFGSRRAFPGAEHDQFFGPFLDARKRAERSLGPGGVRSAFDAASLRAAMEKVLRGLASKHQPRRAPDRRALEAELFEATTGMFAAIDAMGAMQRRVEDSDGADRIARWREWSVLVHDVFIRADAAWLAVHALLDSAGPPARGWRKWFGRGSA
ncbi:MAG TPA: hypothetical protein VJ672_14265 [Gemmatimonadaceae bacterium]|nr:hypothetical protein [Gemmatimonadaceae bacterium]